VNHRGIFFAPAVLVLLAAAVAPARAAEEAKLAFQLTDKGVEIDAGTMGKFAWEYPILGTQASPEARKIIERRVSGRKAALKYEGGGQIDLECAADGAVTMTVAGLAADVTRLRTLMLIDFSYAGGGTWQVDRGQEQPFPGEKGKTFLFQDHGRAITIKSPDGRTLTFAVPEYTYLQLQDNREWGWKIFALQFFLPVNADTKMLQWKIAGSAAEAGAAKILVDRFGQNAQVEWPDKVKAEDELKKDVEDEKAFATGLHPPAWDPYGGLPGSGEKLGLKKTGFFHVEKKGAKWFLADPDGNAFFHLGVCGFGPCDDYTYVKGREASYEWLPPFDGPFKTAFRENDRNVISFHLANTIRKYGAPFGLEAYQARMIGRVRQWGFNSVGAFSPDDTRARKDAHFPYVAHLPLDKWVGIPELPGASSSWDPFDDKNRAQVEKLFAERLPPRADAPDLIGYFLVNEPLYEDLPRAIPALDGKFACKKRLVEMLREKYGTVDRFNKAWGSDAKTFDELADRGLAVTTREAREDVDKFTALFLEAYFKLVADVFHKHDGRHMLLGNRFQSGTINNEPLCRIAGKYLDIMSFNYYTYRLDKDFLDRIYGWTGGKPMILSEFYFDSGKDTGLGGGGGKVARQQDRGLGYRQYVEQAAALGYVVGVEWFTLVDQSVTGRWFSFYNGENNNTGLVAVSDRPWKPMLAEMMKTNYDIYKVEMGERPPFVFDDPRFAAAAGGKKLARISRVPGAMKIDGLADDWPGVPAETISGREMVLGADPGGVEAAFKLAWDDECLYVLAQVTDPTPMKNSHTGADIWSGDGLELFIGAEDLDAVGPLKFADRQVLVRGSVLDGTTECYVANAPAQTPCRIAVVPRVDGKGYTIEAAIPFKALGFKPAEGKEIRFDLAVDDSADGSGRLRQLMWNGTARNSGDRTGWGRAVFGK